MAGIAQIGALPGIGSTVDALSKRLFWSLDEKSVLPGGKIIDGTLSADPTNTADVSVLQAGLLMGKVTATGKYAPSIIGKSTAAYVDNDLTITVALATAVEVIRRIGTSGNLKLIGPATDAAAGAIVSTAVAFTGVTLNGASSTITVPDLNVAKVSGSLICPADGSETILTIIGKEDGIPVADRFGTRYDAAFAEPIVGGRILASQIVNYPAGAALKAYVKAALRAVGMSYVFDDDF
jgi:hypothetical protein